ncbi:MAG: MraZ N-terminal domain containing protein, partial [Acidimicrobiales bacterium]|nr:MraZ N-terminal domain containing protein [Acidimicrobiales bacterium]
MAIVGTHERSLDDKGRLVLPARFRSHFSGVVYLSPGDGCISLWPSERFDSMVASVEEKIRSGELEPNVRRGVSSGS